MSEAVDSRPASLIEAAKAGERWAHEEILQLFSSFSRHIHHRGGGPMAAELDPEDLAQEAGRRFFTVGIHQYSGKGSEKSYLYSIVKSTFIQIWRSQQRRKKREEIVSPADQVQQPESTAKLDVSFLLSRLGPPCSELLERVYLDGASYPTLAAELDLAESSVRAKVSRCLRRARELAQAT